MRTNKRSILMAKAATTRKRSSRVTVTKRKKVSANGARHAQGTVRSTTKDAPLSRDELNKINAYWRAANYLSVGQIYLYDNPLLKKALSKEHIKPRLLGHWGTTPGLNFIYVHLNRLIKEHDLNMLYITGSGDARLDARRWGARIRDLARVRSRLRQPKLDRCLRRRRRRGGDRTTRHQLAFKQVSRSRDRRRCSANSA